MHTKRVVLIVLVIGILLLAAGSLVQAGDRPPFPRVGRGEVSNTGRPISGRFPISNVSNAPTHMAETNPAVAYNSGFMNTYLVVWDQLYPGGSGSAVYGQFVTSNGTLNGIRFRISPDIGYNQHPDVAYNPVHDQYLVVYEVGGIGIYGQIIGNAGAPIGPEREIVSMAGNTYWQPAVAYCPASGRYLVTWQRVQGTSKGIEARAVNADGTLPPGAPLEITGMGPVIEPSDPDVAYDPARDQFLIVWQQWASVSNTTQHDIRGQQVSTTGGAHLVGPNVPIFDSIDDEVRPAVAAVTTSTSDTYLVVAQRWYGGTTSYIDGWAVDGMSSGRGYNLAISAYPGYAPAVAGNEGTDQYLVVWVHDNYTLTGCTISWDGIIDPSYGQLSGRVLSRPAIAAGPLQDYLVAYEDHWESGYPTDIFGWMWGIRVFLPLTVKNY